MKLITLKKLGLLSVGLITLTYAIYPTQSAHSEAPPPSCPSCVDDPLPAGDESELTEYFNFRSNPSSSELNDLFTPEPSTASVSYISSGIIPDINQIFPTDIYGIPRLSPAARSCVDNYHGIMVWQCLDICSGSAGADCSPPGMNQAMSARYIDGCKKKVFDLCNASVKPRADGILVRYRCTKGVQLRAKTYAATYPGGNQNGCEYHLKSEYDSVTFTGSGLSNPLGYCHFAKELPFDDLVTKACTSELRKRGSSSSSSSSTSSSSTSSSYTSSSSYDSSNSSSSSYYSSDSSSSDSSSSYYSSY